jgi:hypothetical protein
VRLRYQIWAESNTSCRFQPGVKFQAIARYGPVHPSCPSFGIPVPNAIIEVKIKPFQYIDCVSSDVFDAWPLVNAESKQGLNFCNVNKAVVSNAYWDLTGPHASFPFGFHFCDFRFHLMVLCDSTTFLGLFIASVCLPVCSVATSQINVSGIPTSSMNSFNAAAMFAPDLLFMG